MAVPTRGAVVFDLDGTLVDSVPDIAAAVNHVLAERDHAPIPVDRVCGFIGRGVPVLIEQVMAAAGFAWSDETHGELVDAFRDYYDRALSVDTRLYPGVFEVLEALAADGLGMGVCTNKPEAPSRRILSDLGVERFFRVLVGGDSLAVRKPDPGPLLHAIGALGDGKALFVGDSEIDAETASRAGVPFALFTEGYRQAPVEAIPHDFRFTDFSALPAIAVRAMSE